MSAKSLMYLCAALLITVSAPARVLRLAVEQTQAVAAYERLTGHFYGELDPTLPLNAVITDLRFAPKNAHGAVEYAATFTLLRPRDPKKASGLLWYEVPNRGNSPLNQRTFTDERAAGHILVSSGWQGDIPARDGIETIAEPIARNPDGSAITGPVLARLSNVRSGASTVSLGGAGYGALRYQYPATLDTSKALLTRQLSDDGAAIPIAPQDWAFANCEKKPFPGEPDPSSVCLKQGFDGSYLYQLTYTAKDPLVLGIGFAATRDLVSFLRYSDAPDNPVRGLVRRAIAAGTSQSGNFIKTFIHLGFNQDESKHIVWEGVNPNIAARQLTMNVRFALPGGAAEMYQPGSEGVLWWSDYRDDARGRGPAGLLDRCRATKTCPKIIETFGASEFWGLRMSPGLTGTRADTDIPLPAEVRRYYFPGVTHGGGRGGFSVKAAPGRACVLADNPNPSSDAMRALRRALADWVTTNAAPPESRYPTLAAGQLVRPDHIAMGFPAIPGFPLPDHLINPLPDYDFGPEFHYADMSGVVTIQPPVIRGYVPMLVPKTDADGNEIGGIPSVLHQVPLGTYLGWNITASGYLKGRECGFAGGFIPFARSKAERLASADPRPSLEERYGTHEAYVSKVRDAARTLVRQRFLLPDDADRLVREAEASEVLR